MTALASLVARPPVISRRGLSIVLLCVSWMLTACDSRPAQESASDQPHISIQPAVSMPEVLPVETSGSVVALGVRMPLPVGWEIVPPSNTMRLAEVRVPSDDSTQACTIAISTAGGTVEGNIARWAGQVRTPDGSPTTGQPMTAVADGLLVTLIELEGTYIGMGRAPAQERWMLRGAIVETPQGLLFIKMMGPLEPMRGEHNAFAYMVTALARQS